MSCNKTNCSGWVYDDLGVVLDRCICTKTEYLKQYYYWSGLEKRHLKSMKQLKDFDIYLNNDLKKPFNYKNEMELLLDSSDELLKGGRVILRGDSNTGKTQFASTLAIELFKKMDWTESKLDVKPFLKINLNELLVKNIFDFNKEDQKDLLLEKVKVSKILILDELGDELNRKETDGNLAKAIELLKTILDSFDGLIIITTNNFQNVLKYEQKRKDIFTRLIGDYENRDNVLMYGFGFKKEEKRDLRGEEVKSEKLNKLKNR